MCVSRWARESSGPVLSGLFAGEGAGAVRLLPLKQKDKVMIRGSPKPWGPTTRTETRSPGVATFPSLTKGTGEPQENRADRCRRQPFFYNISNDFKSFLH